jgi:tRNA nucleotidyltransferase (CCA-adding enzyme)
LARRSVTYPKPGKPVVKPATILDDLRRRDFTANAMAISLNEGSYGLLMDPLNGVADIENRELRLVSNYGFIEDPARMIPPPARRPPRLAHGRKDRAALRHRQDEGYISALSPARAAMKPKRSSTKKTPCAFCAVWITRAGPSSVPGWTSAKANEKPSSTLRDTVGQLEMMGIHPDPSRRLLPAAHRQAAVQGRLRPQEAFARPGFVDQIAALDAETKAFAAKFNSKAAAAPSDAWKMLYDGRPRADPVARHTTKSAPVQARFKAFFNEWSQARQRIPYQLMQEMRITPDLPGYNDLLEKPLLRHHGRQARHPEATQGIPRAVLAARAAAAGQHAPPRRQARGQGAKTAQQESRRSWLEAAGHEDAACSCLRPAGSCGRKASKAGSQGQAASACKSSSLQSPPPSQSRSKPLLRKRQQAPVQKACAEEICPG